MIFVLLLILIVFIVLPYVLLHIISSKCTKEHSSLNSLLVIAHPDDECLFFAPTILSLSGQIYVLCLSNGHNHRADELRRSCQQLNIKDYRIIDDQIHLRDCQSIDWKSESILGHVEQSIRRWNISRIISFDQYGVSGHRNHSSIYYALLKYPQRDLIEFFALTSVPIYRKYLTIIEMIRLYFSPSPSSMKTFVLPVQHCFTPHRAMFQHKSQLVWFRYFYLIFSRYIWINELKQIY